MSQWNYFQILSQQEVNKNTDLVSFVSVYMYESIFGFQIMSKITQACS